MKDLAFAIVELLVLSGFFLTVACQRNKPWMIRVVGFLLSDKSSLTQILWLPFLSRVWIFLSIFSLLTTRNISELENPDLTWKQHFKYFSLFLNPRTFCNVWSTSFSFQVLNPLSLGSFTVQKCFSRNSEKLSYFLNTACFKSKY